ncbi:hypothetical protein EDL99_08450 [Ornithobacterium rhinotracheale]|uniref:hypothetical protein n=1 Tax=Ornithobacterium rhinotracheale TaxID=28251 RepID=UPI00129CBD00|nr:hypothetical protein [Ornithobacterium rhinotracheale]MRJ08892.1 hypothetical protein [Ornithobacterium rhinotracheale]UOH77775.1 hypothetical protein MT996_11300 [Ornithobacterium rhinotracheale]
MSLFRENKYSRFLAGYEPRARKRNSFLGFNEKREVIEEIVSVLFRQESINRLEKGQLEEAFDVNGMTFRLLKTERGNVNIEIFLMDDNGVYWKPVGFYRADSFCKLKDIVIVKEFEKPYSDVQKFLPEELVRKVKFLNLEENAYIAVASREVSNVVKSMFDNPNRIGVPMEGNGMRLTVNSLDVVVRESLWGNIEAVFYGVDDEDDEIFVMFRKEKEGVVAVCQEPMYEKLFEMKLLSAFK